MENNTFKLNSESKHNIELMHDEPKIGTNTYGEYYLYGVKKNNQDATFFATANLHQKLSGWGIGSKLTIVRDEYAPNKFGYNVVVVEGKSKGVSNHTPQESSSVGVDSRTHDIHKQVCLKLSVAMYGSCKKILDETALLTIDANMNQLLLVLEGSSQNTIDAEKVVIDKKSDTEDDFPF